MEVYNNLKILISRNINQHLSINTLSIHTYYLRIMHAVCEKENEHD